MENNKEAVHQNPPGSGSAENMDQDRSRQQNPTTDLPEQEKENIAREIGEAPEKVADLKDLGTVSGRDDMAGGSNDGMEDQSTGQPTDR